MGYTSQFVTTNNVDDEARGIVLQNDGKIVVSGRTYTTRNNYDFGVIRFLTSGVLDTSFHGTGKQSTSIGTSDDIGLAADFNRGEIIVAGDSMAGTTLTMATVRYNVNGSVATSGTFDRSFGTGGVITAMQAPDHGDSIWGLALMSNASGMIVAVGNSGTAAGAVMAAARYHTDGSLDATFGNAGKVLISFPGSATADGYAMAEQPDGKTFLGGDGGATGDFAIARLNTNGTLDTANWGTNGRGVTWLGGSSIYFMAIQPDGKPIALGPGSNNAVALARYNTTGTLDASFNGVGYVLSTLGMTSVAMPLQTQIAIQADGKILIVAEGTAATGTGNFLTARFLTSGILDTSFGTTGVVIHSLLGGDVAQGVTTQPDGKIVTGGQAGGTSFGIIRYNTDGSLNGTFGTNGIVVKTFQTNDQCTNLQFTLNNKILCYGLTQAGGNPQMLVVRQNTDGTLDTGFNAQGWSLVSINTAGSDGYSGAQDPIGRIVIGGAGNGEFGLARLWP